MCAVLVVLSAIDLEHRIPPDRITLPSAAIVLIANTRSTRASSGRIAAFARASLFLFLAVLAYPRGMGMGDVKLALVMGAALGSERVRGDGHRLPDRARPVRSCC